MTNYSNLITHLLLTGNESLLIGAITAVCNGTKLKEFTLIIRLLLRLPDSPHNWNSTHSIIYKVMIHLITQRMITKY